MIALPYEFNNGWRLVCLQYGRNIHHTSLESQLRDPCGCRRTLPLIGDVLDVRGTFINGFERSRAKEMGQFQLFLCKASIESNRRENRSPG